MCGPRISLSRFRRQAGMCGRCKPGTGHHKTDRNIPKSCPSSFLLKESCVRPSHPEHRASDDGPEYTQKLLSAGHQKPRRTGTYSEAEHSKIDRWRVAEHRASQGETDYGPGGPRPSHPEYASRGCEYEYTQKPSTQYGPGGPRADNAHAGQAQAPAGCWASRVDRRRVHQEPRQTGTHQKTGRNILRSRALKRRSPASCRVPGTRR